MSAGRIKLSRQGAIGLLLLAAAAVAAALVAWLPYYWYGTVLDQTDTARTEFKFIEARINASKGASRPHLTAADDVSPLFLAGGTAGLSLADLQARVTALAAASNVTIVRSQPLQSDSQTGLAALRSEVEATGSIENLRNFLIALEGGEPLIFVSEAQISEATDTGEGLPSENLMAVLQVEAYGWWGAAQ